MEESSRVVKGYEVQLVVRVEITVVWVLIQSSTKVSKLARYSEMLMLKVKKRLASQLSGHNLARSL
jgi:hypothetical protein